MGTVYKAYDSKIREIVALKLLKPEIASDIEIIERFRNEIKLARQVSHRHVCRMYDLGEEWLSIYISMEYVPGEDLKSFIRRSGHLNEAKALDLGRADPRGPRRGPPPRRRPPRPQAAEHHDRPRGERQDHGLRHRPLAPHQGRDRDGGHHRHARIHGPGAGGGPRRRPPGRHLRPGGHPLRDGHGPGPLRGRDAPEHRPQAPERAPGRPPDAQRPDLGRPEPVHPEVPREIARPPLPDGGRGPRGPGRGREGPAGRPARSRSGPSPSRPARSRSSSASRRSSSRRSSSARSSSSASSRSSTRAANDEAVRPVGPGAPLDPAGRDRRPQAGPRPPKGKASGPVRPEAEAGTSRRAEAGRDLRDPRLPRPPHQGPVQISQRKGRPGGREGPGDDQGAISGRGGRLLQVYRQHPGPASSRGKAARGGQRRGLEEELRPGRIRDAQAPGPGQRAGTGRDGLPGPPGHETKGRPRRRAGTGRTSSAGSPWRRRRTRPTPSPRTISPAPGSSAPSWPRSTT